MIFFFNIKTVQILKILYNDIYFFNYNKIIDVVNKIIKS